MRWNFNWKIPEIIFVAVADWHVLRKIITQIHQKFSNINFPLLFSDKQKVSLSLISGKRILSASQARLQLHVQLLWNDGVDGRLVQQEILWQFPNWPIANRQFDEAFRSNVGSSKNLAKATFRKMPEAGLKIAQNGLKNTFFVKILPRHLVWLGSG